MERSEKFKWAIVHLIGGQIWWRNLGFLQSKKTYYVKVASHSHIFHENMRSFHINTKTLNQQAQKFKQQFCQYHKIIGKSCAHLSTIKVQILVWIWLMMSVVQTHLRKKIVLIMSYIILIKYKTSVKQC
jgi:hypothetical protein